MILPVEKVNRIKPENKEQSDNHEFFNRHHVPSHSLLIELQRDTTRALSNIKGPVTTFQNFQTSFISTTRDIMNPSNIIMYINLLFTMSVLLRSEDRFEIFLKSPRPEINELLMRSVQATVCRAEDLLVVLY